MDVNDETPVLKNIPYPYQAAIPKEPEPGLTVYELLAEDPDTNSELVYSISEIAGKTQYLYETKQNICL